jgi:hypothetical protein
MLLARDPVTEGIRQSAEPDACTEDRIAEAHLLFKLPIRRLFVRLTGLEAASGR